MKSTKTYGDEQYIYAMALLGGAARAAGAKSGYPPRDAGPPGYGGTGSDAQTTPTTPMTGKEAAEWTR